MNKIEEPAREGFLYHLWLDRTFKDTSLRSIDGRPVEILEKGVRNYDAGPDFLDALVRIDAELFRGDVEIHSIAGDWYAHGHHNDPRYNNVVLHIVTMDCPAGFRTIRQDGTAVPALNLDSFLERSAEELEAEGKAPSTAAPDSCALARQDKDVILRVVEKSGERRFAVKVARIVERRHTDSWDQLFYAALLEALGYSKNQIPFRQLGENLPVEVLWRFVWNDPPEIALKKCEACLFGAAGLLPSQMIAKVNIVEAEARGYVGELEDYWASFPMRAKTNVLKPGAWQFFRLRPANFPTRRIAAAAAYVVRFMDAGFISALQKIVGAFNQNPQNTPRELERLFEAPRHAFWSGHFKFDADAVATAKKESLLLGAERARDMVVNIALPALAAYADEVEDRRLKIAVAEIYYSHPLLKENEITRDMCRRLFGVAKCPALIANARMQQGLIHLWKQVCRPGSCQACLFEKEPSPG